MNMKILEIRDAGTFIPVLCIEMASEDESENYLLWRLGYSKRRQLIQLVWVSNGRTEYDPFKWGDRTLFTAHKFIVDAWNDLKSGDVIDVEYILMETDEPKLSERGDVVDSCSECRFYVDAPDYLDVRCYIYPWRALPYSDITTPDWCPLRMMKAPESEE